MDLVERFGVYLIGPALADGSKPAKRRPCVVVSPDEMNRHLATVIVAPMTTTLKGWPTRVALTFESTQGEIALDQIHTVDKARLAQHLGDLRPATAEQVNAGLSDMFAP